MHDLCGCKPRLELGRKPDLCSSNVLGEWVRVLVWMCCVGSDYGVLRVCACEWKRFKSWFLLRKFFSSLSLRVFSLTAHLQA